MREKVTLRRYGHAVVDMPHLSEAERAKAVSELEALCTLMNTELLRRAGYTVEIEEKVAG